MKTLVLGGYGNFGARIARGLARDPAITLLIGGRDGRQAQALAAELGAAPLVLDAASPVLVQTLRAQGVELLIHSAGPFQQQAYGVAEAAAAAGAHYIDLADGRRFVCDLRAALDERYQAAGRCAVTGASTVPGLSTAVIDHLCAGWQQILSIETCIAPAQTAPRGIATMRAVLSYCGAPIPVWQQGRWTQLPGWAHPVAVQFARMKPRLGALCDIPDLELLPQRHPGVQTVMFRAALEVGLAQRGFAWLAALRRAGVLTRPERWAGLLNRLGDGLNAFGSDTGGMVLRVRGLDARGQPRQRAWHITAGNDHGPEIPCMAAILLARRWARGEQPPPGAGPCAGLLALADFAPEFARWGMVSELIEEKA